MLKMSINYLDKVIRPLNILGGAISSLLLLVIMFFTSGDVISRYFFSKPFQGSYEITSISLAIIVFFGMSYAQQKKGHIMADVLLNKLSPRAQSIADSIIYFIVVVFLLIFAWQTYKYSIRSSKIITDYLSIPISIFINMCVVALLLFCLTVLLDFLRSILKVGESR